MKIRTISAELLREGPRHNQLLSPLTRYLGVCGDENAGVVSLPWEHSELMELLDELRYKVFDEEAPARRDVVLSRTGTRIAKILNQIPGLGCAVSPTCIRSETLVHLRLVLSASELALLPFEVSKVPSGAGLSENWLLLRSNPRVCLTRKTRAVSTARVKWPEKPKILYVTGQNVPVEEHREALRKAIEPWVTRKEPESDWLRTLEDADLKAIRQACEETPYTHVHVLAHGVTDESRTGKPYGVLLGGEALSGGDLASALVQVSSNGDHVPTVVTLATCDSAQQKQVYTPDVSVAHELHERGIPLVVASQFPLTVEGSKAFVGGFYSDQMWGRHPLLTLYRTRLGLIGPSGLHDWASLVIYEALPDDLGDQLHNIRYWQVRRASDAALDQLEECLDRSEPPSQDQYDRVVAAIKELEGISGPFETECVGLRASAHKRLAEAHFTLSQRESGSARDECLRKCRSELESAVEEYEKAVDAFLVNTDQPIHRKATLHWVGIQALSLRAVLGKALNEELRMASRLAATVDLKHMVGAGERGWAHGSLCELALLALADENISDAQVRELSEEAVKQAGKIVRWCGRGSEQAQFATRQFRRYFNWWGDESFDPPKKQWHRPNGVVATAKRVAEILAGPEALARIWRPRKVKTGPKVEPGGRPDGGQEGGGEREPPKPGRAVAARLASRQTLAAADSKFVIEMLPAHNGDCLWIEYGPAQARSRLIVDCGAVTAVNEVKERLVQVRNQTGENNLRFDLFILTHIDSDHIGGATSLFKTVRLDFDDIWFNGWPQLPKESLDPKFLGVKQGEEYSKLLAEQERPWNRRAPREEGRPPGPMRVPKSGELSSYELPGGMIMTLLSPGEEELERLAKKWAIGRRELQPSQRFLGGRRPPTIKDLSKLDLEALSKRRTEPDTSVANGSSIAVLAEYGDRSALLLGDAHAEVVAASIRRLQADRNRRGKPLAVDAVKLSHHGSANGLSDELLGLLKCRRYLVSTDGSHFYHPDREAIARVVVQTVRPQLFFNYAAEDNQCSSLWADEDLQKRYSFRAFFPPAGKPGMRVPL